MFKWLKKLFRRRRLLVEQFEVLKDIITKHNELIVSTNNVAELMPPSYLIFRFETIQASESYAINNPNKWIIADKTAPEETAEAADTPDKPVEPPPAELTAQAPLTALEGTEAPRQVEAGETQQQVEAATEPAQALEQTCDKVVEIYIDSKRR